MQETLRTCTKCGETKPLEQYNRHKNMRGGRTTQCKVCTGKANKGRPKKKVELQCHDCGVSFSRRSDNIKEINRCLSCSSKESGRQRRGRILEKSRKGQYVKCDNCQKEHYKKLSQIKKGHSHYFCNNLCQGEWSAKHYVPNQFIRSSDNSGERNGRYLHGNRVGGHDRHKSLKRKLIHRDGEGCFICRIKERLHVHRIIPGALGGKYEIDNTVMLCNVHHAAVHKDYESWKEKLVEMINRKG